MNKLLIICGPTATGKTKLGIHLAKKFNGEIISADSRQVYKGMDIGTGKGLEDNFQFSMVNFQNLNKAVGYYAQGQAKIWGYDLVEPNQEFSIAEYCELMSPVLEDIWSRKKLPIIVGGTGFYIDALINPPETLGVTINQDLRNKLEQLGLLELQAKLATLDSQKLADMNNSDRNNPRRLIRAIEVAEQDKSRDVSTSPLPKWQSDNLNIGLTASKDHLKQRVVSSVRKRASSEFAKELTTLEKKEFDWSSPAASATGYKEWQGYLSGEISRREAIQAWITREHQYQKRQLTWFNKNPMINWFDVENKQLYSSVEDKLQAWYS